MRNEVEKLKAGLAKLRDAIGEVAGFANELDDRLEQLEDGGQ
ncbi:MAG: hypothetical protein ACJ8C4_06725 [Gemmataceae bacterium]